MNPDNYDPVKSLKKEVDRFRATNHFNPLDVTQFYVQAWLVLSELERTQAEIKRLKDENWRIKEAVVAFIHSSNDHVTDFFMRRYIVTKDACDFIKPTE